MKRLLPLCAALAFASPAAAQTEQRGFNGHCVPLAIADEFFGRAYGGTLHVVEAFGPNRGGFTILLMVNAKWQIFLVATPDGKVCSFWDVAVPGEPA